MVAVVCSISSIFLSLWPPGMQVVQSALLQVLHSCISFLVLFWYHRGRCVCVVCSASTSFSNNSLPKSIWTPPRVEYDWNYLCDPRKTDEICENISHRKGVGDINRVVSPPDNFWLLAKLGHRWIFHYIIAQCFSYLLCFSSCYLSDQVCFDFEVWMNR